MDRAHDLSHKIATQHGLIDSLLRGLRAAIESGDAAQARGRLGSLQRAIDAHFTLEENHYYPARRVSRPGVEAGLDQLVDEHVRLRRDLAKIGDALEIAAWDAVAEDVAAFDASLHEHEQLEHELLGP